MNSDKDRTRRDQAGVGPDPTHHRSRLISLHDLDGYSIRDGEPDIRGWDVQTLGGRELGEVEDLLVDPERGEVVMLELELRGEGVHAEVPIRSVQIDRARKLVLVDSGDIDSRHEVRARDRVDVAERDRVRSTHAAAPRRVGYDSPADADTHADLRDDGVDEVVIERRPVVEEVVVRRRVVEEE